MNDQSRQDLESGTEEELIIEEIGVDEGTEAPAAGAPAAEGEDELENYSKNVQKRISRLTEKMRKEERDRQEAERLARQLLDQNTELQSRLRQLDSGYLSEYGARIEAQINSARRAYKEAHEAGDADRMIEAQEALSRAVADKGRYDLAKGRADRNTQQAAQQAAQQATQQRYVQQQPQQYAQQAQPQPQPDPKARAWAEKNSWFGQDEVMTYAAFGVHRKLVEEEGFDPQSEEYYSEVDRRIRAEFPHKFATAKSSGMNRVAPAGSSASRSTNPGRRVVKLTPSQVAIARRLGVSLEDYAKHVKD
jgi:hypothetical protein